MKFVEDSGLLPEAGQNHPFSFLLPITFRLRIISLVVLTHKEKPIVYVDANVDVELLATTFADKHMANALPNHMLVLHWQRLKILVTDFTEVNPVSLCLSWEVFSSPKSMMESAQSCAQ